MSSENFSSARHPLASLSPSSVNRQQNSKKRSLTSSPSSYGKGPGRHHRRTTLKRSFGVLNLSLGQSPKVEHVIKKKPPTKHRKDPTTMVQSFSELRFEEATRQPALMPTSSYDVNEQEDSPSKCALAHRLGSRRGPLDKGGSLFSMTSADSSNGTSMAINSRELESDDTCYLKPPASRFNVLTSEFGANSTMGAGCDNEQTGTLKSLNQRVPAWAPRWFQDGSAPLDKVVAWMIDPNPENRPSAGQILKSYECSLVNLRRKSGATIYEGDYGPHLVANNPDDKHILTAEQCLGKTRYKLSDMITRK